MRPSDYTIEDVIIHYITVIQIKHNTKQNQQYANDVLNSSVFGLGIFRFPYLAFVTALELVSETYESATLRYDGTSCLISLKVRIYL